MFQVSVQVELGPGQGSGFLSVEEAVVLWSLLVTDAPVAYFKASVRLSMRSLGRGHLTGSSERFVRDGHCRRLNNDGSDSAR